MGLMVVSSQCCRTGESWGGTYGPWEGLFFVLRSIFP